MISFIVPAHNEQACLGRTLRAIHESARATDQPYEIIVVDDASTDATAEIARQNQARVVGVNHRQIAATRNAGGRAALGDRLFFVDADTTINPRVVAAALRSLDQGAAGGGAWSRLEGAVPLYGHLAFWLIVSLGIIVGFTGGAFMFCTRVAFAATGGFNERLFCAEEIGLAFALKREGRFVVLWEHVRTSGRRFRTTSGLQVLLTFARFPLFPARMLTQRESVKNIWYESNRDDNEKVSGSLAVRVSNGLALIFLLILVLQPVWMMVTTCWPQTLAGPLGTVRRIGGMVTVHVGLLLWPGAWFLLRVLPRQTRWAERIKLAALIAFCLWAGWRNTRQVVALWTGFYYWLAN